MSSSATLSGGGRRVIRNETEHTSEQNLRCFAFSALPHSMQVFGMGGCILCHARLGARSTGSGVSARRSSARPSVSTLASQPATACAAGRQIGAIIARWLEAGVVLNNPSLRNRSRWYDGRLEIERRFVMPCSVRAGLCQGGPEAYGNGLPLDTCHRTASCVSGTASDNITTRRPRVEGGLPRRYFEAETTT
jgi:hypothetical protein